MKLWYQSMSRQAEWGGYPRVLRGILDKVRGELLRPARMVK